MQLETKRKKCNLFILTVIYSFVLTFSIINGQFSFNSAKLYIMRKKIIRKFIIAFILKFSAIKDFRKDFYFLVN